MIAYSLMLNPYMFAAVINNKFCSIDYNRKYEEEDFVVPKNVQISGVTALGLSYDSRGNIYRYDTLIVNTPGSPINSLVNGGVKFAVSLHYNNKLYLHRFTYCSLTDCKTTSIADNIVSINFCFTGQHRNKILCVNTKQEMCELDVDDKSIINMGNPVFGLAQIFCLHKICTVAVDIQGKLFISTQPSGEFTPVNFCGKALKIHSHQKANCFCVLTDKNQVFLLSCGSNNPQIDIIPINIQVKDLSMFNTDSGIMLAIEDYDHVLSMYDPIKCNLINLAKGEVILGK